jgi:hypothetical protein
MESCTELLDDHVRSGQRDRDRGDAGGWLRVRCTGGYRVGCYIDRINK